MPLPSFLTEQASGRGVKAALLSTAVSEFRFSTVSEFRFLMWFYRVNDPDLHPVFHSVRISF